MPLVPDASGSDRRAVGLLAVRPFVVSGAVGTLLASVIVHLVLLQRPRSMEQVDLRVYAQAPPRLWHGDLYDFTTSQFTPDFPLPFTYPPFAALVLMPLSWVPFVVLVHLWHLGSIGALWWLVRRTLGLLDVPDAALWACPWTAVALWWEPVRTTLNYGQVNLLLAALVLAALTARSGRWAGIGLGLAAGIKLVPAIGGLYLLATGRRRALGWAVGAALGTVGVAALAAPGQSARYWFDLVAHPERIGPVGSAINQSLRGALSRSVGADVGTGWPWLLAVLAAGALAGWAVAAAVRVEARPLAALLAVQLFGLLASPVSWSHHWVWVVPALVWAVHGPARRHPLVRAAAAVWAVAISLPVVQWLLAAQPSIWVVPRPWPLALAGWVYPAAAVLLLIAIGVGYRALRPALSPRRAPGRSRRPAPHPSR